MLIGLNGLKNSGKNTVGSYLVENYGFEERSFAKLLKDSAAALFQVDPELWEKYKNDDGAFIQLALNQGPLSPPTNISNMSVRVFLQRYGTEAHRTVFGADFWVDYAVKGVDPNKDIVFTDARFENELRRIKSLGGHNLQILRPELFTQDSHASEVPPPQHLIDYAVDNDGSFDRLYNQVDDFISTLDSELVVGGTYGDWRDNPGNYGE